MTEPFSRRSAPPWAPRAIIGAAGVTAWLLYVTGAAGIGTSDRDYVFSPSDPTWAQSMVAALDVPVGATPSPSAVGARGSIAIAKGRRSAARDFAAVATALAVVAFGAWLLAAGVDPFLIGLVMLAMSVSAMFWARGMWWSAGVLSPALGLAAAWSWWRWLDGHRRGFAIAAFVFAALAAADDAAWVAVLPAFGVLMWQRLSVPDRVAERRVPIAALIAIAASAAWPFITLTSVAGAIEWARMTGATPPDSITLWSQAAISPGHSSLRTLIGDLTREFTPLGVALVAIGTVVLWRATSHRIAMALGVVGLLAWYWLMPRSRFEPIAVPLAICGWATVVIALGWLLRSAPSRVARPLVVAVGLALIAEPALTRMRLAALGKDLPSDARARVAADFRIADLPSGAALVAESRRSDAAILLSSRLAGQPAPIVPQSIETVAAVQKERPVFALPQARANLERVGFLFERVWSSNSPISAVAGYVPCVDLARTEWSDVSLHLAGRSFSIHGTPGAPTGGVVLRLAAPTPIRVRSIEPRGIPFEVSEAPRDPRMAGVPELDLAAARSGVATVTTLRVPETGRVEPVTIYFDEMPVAAVATGESPATAMLCGGVQREPLTLGRTTAATGALRMQSSTPFGVGWHTVEADPDFFRWTAAESASVHITMAQPGPVRVTITATPAARPAQQPAIDLTVNHCRLQARPMPSGQHDYEWDVAGDCWRPGYNQIWIGTGPLVSPASLGAGTDTRPLGARIGAIRFARDVR